MLNRGRIARRQLSWEGSIGRGLHRAGGRVASVIGSQFDLVDPTGTAIAQVDGNVLNVRPDPVDFRDVIYAAPLVELKAYMPESAQPLLDLGVRQQGTEGSCTGQALAAVVDFQNAPRLRSGAKVPTRVSARMLYESARAFDE